MTGQSGGPKTAIRHSSWWISQHIKLTWEDKGESFVGFNPHPSSFPLPKLGEGRTGNSSKAAYKAKPISLTLFPTAFFVFFAAATGT